MCLSAVYIAKSDSNVCNWKMCACTSSTFWVSMYERERISSTDFDLCVALKFSFWYIENVLHLIQRSAFESELRIIAATAEMQNIEIERERKREKK